MLDREAGEIGLPDLRQIGWDGTVPPEPERGWRFRGSWQAFDLQTNECPTDQRPRLTRPACGVVLRNRMKSVPGLHPARPGPPPIPGMDALGVGQVVGSSQMNLAPCR